MESFFTENLLYCVIGIVLVATTLFMVLQGWLMKLAVRICGGNEIGIFYGISALTLSSLAGTVASVTAVILLPQDLRLLAALASLLGSILMLCLMLQMGPIRAFMVFLTQGFLSLLAVAGLSAVLVAGVYFLVPQETLTQLAGEMRSRATNIQTDALADDLTGQESEQVNSANLNSLEMITKVLESTKLTWNEAQTDSEEGDGKGDTGKFSTNPLFPAKLGDVLFKASEPETAKGDASDEKPNAALQRPTESAPPIRSPYDNKIRTNPYAY